MKMLKTGVITLFMICFHYAVFSETDISVNLNGSNVINTISDLFFGINYWLWLPTWGNSVAGTEARISPLNVKLLRFGGINNDVGKPDDIDDAAMKGFNNYCSSIDAAPLFQLQLAKYPTTETRVSNALSLCDSFKRMNPSLKYVSIGNEPDIYISTISPDTSYHASFLSNYSVNDYCTDFNAMASELKKRDSTLKIVGLELSWNRSVWVPAFVSKCKDNVDIVSVHYYPFSADQCLYSAARNQVAAIKSFYSATRQLIDKNAGGKSIPLLIGECNITYNGDPALSNLDASPGTFNAALWWADFIGVSSAQNNLVSIMPWSIREGWTLGFLDDDKKPRPTYYVYKMFSNSIKKTMIHNEDVNGYVHVYGYKDDSGNVSIFAANWDTTNSYNTTFNFSNILGNNSYQYTLPIHSLTCFEFSSDFSNKTITLYTSTSAEPQVISTGIKSHSKSDLGVGDLKISFEKNAHSLIINSPIAVNKASISIITLQGKTVKEIALTKLVRGTTVIPFDSKILKSGVYLARIMNVKKAIAEVNIKVD